MSRKTATAVLILIALTAICALLILPATATQPVTPVADLSAGDDFAAIIKADGTVASWGGNASGQLGLGNYISKSSMQTVTAGFTDLEAGFYATLGIREDGTLWAWGNNGYGELGQGNTIGCLVPTRIQMTGAITDIAMGWGGHAMAVKSDGSLWAWGSDSNEKLGNGDTLTDVLSPAQVGTGSFAAVAAGQEFSLALKEDGSLWSWGANNYGQLGRGAATTYAFSQPMLVSSGPYESIDAGNFHGVAVKRDGTLWTWGSSGQGQLGQGAVGQAVVPTQVGTGSFATIDAGRQHSLAVKDDGSLWVWGYNNFGQLGDGSQMNRTTPVIIGTGSFNRIAGGAEFSLAMKEDGQLYSFGGNEKGQLGIGAQMTTSYTQLNKRLDGPYSEVYAWGMGHTDDIFLLEADGTAWAMGKNEGGQHGNGTTAVHSTPVQVQATHAFSMLSPGGNVCFGIATDGSLWSWGREEQSGKLGDGGPYTETKSVLYPEMIGTGSFSAVAEGSGGMLALKSDGSLWSWGSSYRGLLGIGQTQGFNPAANVRTAPAPVPTTGGFVKLAAGGQSGTALALKSDGSLWAWGDDYQGQCGQGTSGFREPGTCSYNVPMLVPSTGTFTRLICGFEQNAAIKDDGSLWMWGRSDYSGIADYDAGIPKPVLSVPYNVQTGGFTAFAEGQLFNVAIKNDGGVWIGGNNGAGQLGTGGTGSVSWFLPYHSGPFTKLACGYDYTALLDSSGALWTAGDNSSGQFGDGGSWRITPVLVGDIATAPPAFTYHPVAADRTPVFVGAAMPGDGISAWVAGSSVAFAVASNPTGSFVIVLPTLSYTTYDFFLRAADAAGNTADSPHGSLTIKWPPTYAFDPGWGTDGVVGGEGTGDGQLYGPYGVVADGAGNVYVADSQNHRIEKFSSTGAFISKWGKGAATGAYGNLDGEFDTPFGMTFDADGFLYVADQCNYRIQKLTSTGGFVAKWGRSDSSPGSGDGEMNQPTDVAVDTAGYVYVADSLNNRVQKFSPTGGFVSKWGKGAATGDYGPGDGEFYGPTGIALGKDGNIYVADYVNSRVQYFTPDGEFLGKWGRNGGDGSTGSYEGEFICPVDVDCDAEGNVYVTDEQNSSIQKFSPSGAYLGHIGRELITASFQPACIDIDNQGNVLFTHYPSLVQRLTRTSPAVTTIHIDPAAPNGNNGWYITAPTLSFTTSDPAEVLYHDDMGQTTSYLFPFNTWPAEGFDGYMTLSYWSVMPNGLAEQTREQGFKVDRQAPIPMFIGALADGYYNQPVSVSVDVFGFEASFSASYTMDGAPYTSGTTVSAEGTHAFALTGIEDEAGNIGATSAYSFNLDYTKPTFSYSGIGAGLCYPGDVKPEVTVHEQHPDTHSFALGGGLFHSGTSFSAEGAQQLVLNATDAAGNAADTVTVAFAIDRTAPTFDVSGLVDGGVYGGTVTPTFSVVDSNPDSATFYLDGTPGMVSGHAVPTEGSHSLSLFATDKAGNDSGMVVYTFRIDKTKPTFFVTGFQNGVLYGTDVTPTITVNDDVSVTRSFTLDGSPYTSGTAVTSDGLHTLVMNATDAAGNAADELTRSFTIDKTKPTFSYSGVTDGGMYNASVTPAITVNEAHPGTQLFTLDGSGYSSGTAVSIDGHHALTLEATDEAGNVAVPVAVDFTIDKSKPQFVINGAADGVNYNTPVTPLITIDEAHPGSSSMTLDGNPFINGTTVSTDGQHVLVLNATDALGNVADQVTYTFHIDRTKPVFSVGGVSDGALYRDTVTPTYSLTEANPFSSPVRLDGVLFTSGTAVPTEGFHALVLTAEDLFGNLATPMTVTFTIDKTAPGAPVPDDGTSVPMSRIYPNWSRTFTWSPNGDVELYEYRRDGGTAYETTANSEFLSWSQVSTDGTHFYSVRARDAAGNWSSWGTHSFTYDTTSPLPPLLTQPLALTNSTSVLLSGTAEANSTVKFEYNHEAVYPTVAVSPGGTFSYWMTGVGEYADNLFTAFALDAAGNWSDVSNQVTVNVDITAPGVPLPNDGVTPPSRDNTPTFTWPAVSGSPAGYEYRIGQSPGTPTTATSVTLPAQPQGTYSFSVRSFDAVGNRSAWATHAYVIDTVLPAVSLTKPAALAWVRGKVAVAATAKDMGVGASGIKCVVFYFNGVKKFTDSYAPYGGYIATGTASGAKAFKAIAYDKAGNAKTYSRTVTVDNYKPRIAYTASLLYWKRGGNIKFKAYEFRALPAVPVLATARIYSGIRLIRTLPAKWVYGKPLGYATFLYWNGKNSAGAYVAKGRYIVKTTLKDKAGNTNLVAGYLTIR